MKWYEMQNLYVGYNEDADFRVLICAFDIWEADEILRGYALDSDIEGDWEITEADQNTSKMRFDCDYIITGGQ